MLLYRIWYVDPDINGPFVRWLEMPANDPDEALTRFWLLYEERGFRVIQMQHDVKAGGPK